MDDKWNLQCPEKNIHRNLQKCIIFNILPKISHSFQGIQHYMVNLWKYCVYSTVRYWYHAKFAMGSRKKIGCKIKVAGRCASRYSILSFGAITKICFIFINYIYLTLRSGFYLILINMIYTIEADFRPDTKWKILHLESHRFAVLFWRSDCYPATGPKFCAILMMTSSNGYIFRVTGHLCGEFTGPRWIPHTKASDAELWCFLWSALE